MLSPGDFFIFLSVLISTVALIISILVAKKIFAYQTYTDLDTLYGDVLKIGIDHPNFRDPAYTTSYDTKFQNGEGDKNLHAYESYAYFVWNVCESIYDKTKDGDKNDDTWLRVINVEKKLHGKWFDNTDNHNKFKAEFRQFVNDLKV